ncbi:hypothetical protein D1P53_003331 [Cryptococcus gattii VGV]|nr:hypothetical protein D1P53_003331 [Cryptococcus gattii VGV]
MSHVDNTVDEATINAIRQRLLETGDWERHTLHHALFYKWCISHMAKIRLQLKKRTQNWNRASHAKYVLLRAHLEESGWVDDLKDLAKARAQDVPNLENLVKQISESAAGMVSANVKRDVMLEIESVLDREVEKA